jgi:hypothetical protein
MRIFIINRDKRCRNKLEPYCIVNNQTNEGKFSVLFVSHFDKSAFWLCNINNEN